MKAEIKERIEMISRGEVPEGYKKTKVGIIPEDWEVKRFGQEFKVNQGLQIPIKDRHRKKVQGSYVYITNDYLNNLNDGYEVEYIKDPSKTVICTSRDILMTRTGNTGIVVTGVEGVFHNNFFKVKYDDRKHNYKFIVYLFKSSQIQHDISRLAGTSTIPDLTHSDFYSLESAFPPLPEQKKIAQILSTWDKAIELKEQLLEVKKEQKKGLMQGLLTGEVRLPGYDEEWEEVRLGDIGEFSTSSVNKKIENKQELVRLVNYMDVYNNYIIDDSIDYMIVSATESQIDKFSLQKGDVLFTPSSETADDIGHSAVVKTDQGKLLYSYHLVRLRFKKLMDLDFKGYVFNNTDILGKFTKLASGATRYTLNLDDFRETSIKIPKSLEEQKAIAQVLSTANKEIELLEEELEQLKLQKKGLMQLLLTGIIRVKS